MVDKKLALSALLVVLGCTALATTLTGCTKDHGYGRSYDGFVFPPAIRRDVGVGIAGDGGDGTDGECAGCEEQ